MSRADGVLRVVLAGKWFDMIERGEKLEEYRKDAPGKFGWARKLLDKVGAGLVLFGLPMEAMKPGNFRKYEYLVASRGYTSRTLTRKIKRIRWGQPRPEWSGDTVTGACFVIELEPKEAGE